MSRSRYFDRPQYDLHLQVKHQLSRPMPIQHVEKTTILDWAHARKATSKVHLNFKDEG